MSKTYGSLSESLCGGRKDCGCSRKRNRGREKKGSERFDGKHPFCASCCGNIIPSRAWYDEFGLMPFCRCYPGQQKG